MRRNIFIKRNQVRERLLCCQEHLLLLHRNLVLVPTSTHTVAHKTYNASSRVSHAFFQSNECQAHSWCTYIHAGKHRLKMNKSKKNLIAVIIIIVTRLLQNKRVLNCLYISLSGLLQFGLLLSPQHFRDNAYIWEKDILKAYFQLSQSHNCRDLTHRQTPL